MINGHFGQKMATTRFAISDLYFTKNGDPPRPYGYDENRNFG